jgi:hypothetical protein
MRYFLPNKIAVSKHHRYCSFGLAMKCEHHLCSERQSTVAEPKLWRDVVSRFYEKVR